MNSISVLIGGDCESVNCALVYVGEDFEDEVSVVDEEFEGVGGEKGREKEVCVEGVEGGSGVEVYLVDFVLQVGFFLGLDF